MRFREGGYAEETIASHAIVHDASFLLLLLLLLRAVAAVLWLLH